MFKSHLHKVKKFYWLLLLPFIAGVFITSCGDTPVTSETSTSFTDSSDVNNDITFVPEQFNAVGTIQGTIIDQATSKSLSGVAVSLNFSPEGGEPSVVTDTTGSEGTFAFTGVPVNTEGHANTKNSPYTLKITTENLDNYRDLYRVNTTLAFQGTSGDGAATGLVSDVTIPLNERAVTVNGKLHTSNGNILSDVNVKLYQEISPVMNGSAGTADVLLDDTTTAADGSFTFEEVEKNATLVLVATDDSDPANVIDFEGMFNTGTKATEDLGVVTVFSSQIEDRSGAFYLTSVTPEPGSDVNPDTVFTYVFNRPVAESEYTRTDLGFGNGTIKDDIQFNFQGNKKAPGDVEFSVSWSDGHDSLMVDPEGGMEDASFYTLDISDAFTDDKFVDEYGNGLSFGASEYDFNEVAFLDFSSNANNAKPHTVSVAVDSSSLNSDWDGGSHRITWSVSDDPAEVKEYEVYISKDGGAFEHLQTINSNQAEYGEIEYFLVSDANPGNEFSNFNFARRPLADETSDPIDEAISYEVKIRAISANLQEGDFSNTITFEDITQPDLANVTRGVTNDDVLYVQFTEPLPKGLAEDAAHYTINDAGGSDVDAAINATSYDFTDVNNPDDGLTYDLAITFDDPTDLDTGVELEVSTDVTDLAGNEIDTNTSGY